MCVTWLAVSTVTFSRTENTPLPQVQSQDCCVTRQNVGPSNRVSSIKGLKGAKHMLECMGSMQLEHRGRVNKYLGNDETGGARTHAPPLRSVILCCRSLLQEMGTGKAALSGKLCNNPTLLGPTFETREPGQNLVKIVLFCNVHLIFCFRYATRWVAALCHKRESGLGQFRNMFRNAISYIECARCLWREGADGIPVILMNSRPNSVLSMHQHSSMCHV